MVTFAMKKILAKTLEMFKRKKERRIAPWDYERQTFEKEARKQFLQLKEKGLSIPVITL